MLEQGRPYPGGVTAPVTIGALMDATVGTDPARPLVTYYDHTAEERVELSATTLRNWVDKTANLLRDVLGADAGSRVSLSLPTHWQAVVWLLACWRLGAVVVADSAGPDVAVVSPEAVATQSLPAANEVVATALHPLGAAFSVRLPVGVTDYGIEVFSQADVFAVQTTLHPGAPAWAVDSALLDHAALLRLAADRATELGIAARGRLASDADVSTLAGAVELVLVPLLVDGTVVVIRNADPARLEQLLDTERVDVAATGGSPGR